MDVCNVLVVVTRWYGGILLGPSRFTHINNAARLLLEGSIVSSSRTSPIGGTKKTKSQN